MTLTKRETVVKALRSNVAIAAIIVLAAGFPAHAQDVEPDHIRGQIVENAGSSIVVKMRDGETVRLATSEDLTIISLEKGSFTKVEFGSYVGAVAVKLEEFSPIVRDAVSFLHKGHELRIIDEHGNGLAAGEEGELAMRGPGVFIGYYGQDAFYAEQLTADGFFRTGDLACLDADGYVRITGRLKDMIIRGGVNIAPVPIEDALASHPNVAAVAVIGAPDERLGERICAVVVAAGPAPGLEELNAHLTARGLPKYHCPESLLLVDAMPMTPAGKIRKADLRATLFPKHEGGAA